MIVVHALFDPCLFHGLIVIFEHHMYACMYLCIYVYVSFSLSLYIYIYISGLNAVSPENIHVQAMCDAMLTTSKGQEQGQGVLEQLVIGPHAPSGFTELMDFA